MAPPPTLPRTLLNTLSTHTAPINALTFSSLGGTYILTGSSDRQIHLSRTIPSDSSSTSSESKKTALGPIQKYSVHGYPVLSVACSQSNETFVSAGGDRSVFLWDVQTTATLRRFGSNVREGIGHTRAVNSVTFAGEGDSVVVSGSDDRRVLCWDTKSRDQRPIAEMEEARDGISALWVSDGVVVAGSVDGRVRWYDLRMGQVNTDVLPSAVVSLEGTRDGKTVLVGTLDSKIRMIDGADGKCLQTFSASEDAGTPTAEKVAYTNTALRLKSCLAQNDSLVLAGSEGDGRVRAWDVLSGEMVGSVPFGESGKVVSVVGWREGNKAAGRDGVWAAGGVDGAVRVYGT